MNDTSLPPLKYRLNGYGSGPATGAQRSHSVWVGGQFVGTIIEPLPSPSRAGPWSVTANGTDQTANLHVGLKLTAEEVAEGIVSMRNAGTERPRRQNRHQFHGADPSAFAQDGGPSIAERMSKRGIYFRRLDNACVSQRGAMGGWDQVRSTYRGRWATDDSFLLDMPRQHQDVAWHCSMTGTSRKMLIPNRKTMRLTRSAMPA